MKNGNPAITRMLTATPATGVVSEPCTYRGIALKSLYFVGLTFLSAIISVVLFQRVIAENYPLYYGVSVGCAIAAVISGLLAYRIATPVLGSVYVLSEGFLVGTLSMLFEGVYRGIVFGALLATVITLGITILLNATGVLRAGRRLRNTVFIAMISVVVVQLLLWLLTLILPSIALVFANSFWLQLLVCVVMTCLAAFNLLIDVDNVNQIVACAQPKSLEWKASFSLVVSLIWLYVEFLRILAIFADRKD